MGIFQDLKNAFINEEEETEETTETTEDVGIPDSTWQTCQSAIRIWQLQYAMSVVAKILSTFLINVDWKTFKGDEDIRGDEWFRFNYAPNRKETTAEFYTKLANKFVYDGEALIIETATKEFFIADGYSFKNGTELFMKDNTFVDVVIGDTTLNRSFKENDSCMYIKTPQYENMDLILNSMSTDFDNLRTMIYEGAQKALGTKYSLNLNAQAKNKYDDKYVAKIQKIYEPLMRKRDAVFVTYKGEKLEDLTERQRGSEVQQVLTAVENNIKVNEEILTNVGNAFGIPEKFMKGDFTADNDSIYVMGVTLFAKPYLTLLSKKYTNYVLTKDDILKGSKVEANLDSIKFIEALGTATAIDKLIGSGAYSPNEVREMLGDDGYDGGETRFITKNYAVLSDYTRGGNTTE